MRRLASLCAAALLSLSIMACSSGLNHGTITGKQYDAPYSYVSDRCAYWGKYGCKFWLPVVVDVPGQYVLNLKDGKQTGSTTVDEYTWDRAKVGEKYP